MITGVATALVPVETSGAEIVTTGGFVELYPTPPEDTSIAVIAPLIVGVAEA